MDDIFYAKAAAFIGAAITMGFGSLGPAIGQGLIGMKACENIGKYPESANKIRTAMVLSLAIVESCAVYCLIIAGGLLIFGGRVG
jgi:F-type H+-transporting ATPase subunit c